jgi:hypothetical protein
MSSPRRHQLPDNAHSRDSEPPSDTSRGAFEYARVERPEDLPPADPGIVDVAVLDMNHGWQNLGHDCLIQALRDDAGELLPVAEETGVRVRAISFDVRRCGMIPELPGGRFALYVGTGGPGHIDPYANDGVSAESQGIREDPSWQAPVFRLFDAIAADEGAALLAVCHTFGVMCHWSGLAYPVLRGPEKGGKSTGVLENVLDPAAWEHPWFHRFGDDLGPGGRLRVMDNRLFDLLPRDRDFPTGTSAIGWETLGVGGPAGDAVTMIEFARDGGGLMPRVFGVNHHPEVIVDREGQAAILKQKVDRGEVTEQWAAERREILERGDRDEAAERSLQLTSDYTLLRPLRFHLQRQVRRRAESLGFTVDLDENRIALGPVSPSAASRLPILQAR